MAEWAPKPGDAFAMRVKLVDSTPVHVAVQTARGECGIAPWHSGEELAAMEHVIEAASGDLIDYVARTEVRDAVKALRVIRARAQEAGDG